MYILVKDKTMLITEQEKVRFNKEDNEKVIISFDIFCKILSCTEHAEELCEALNEMDKNKKEKLIAEYPEVWKALQHLGVLNLACSLMISEVFRDIYDEE